MQWSPVVRTLKSHTPWLYGYTYIRVVNVWGQLLVTRRGMRSPQDVQIEFLQYYNYTERTFKCQVSSKLCLIALEELYYKKPM